MSNTVNLQISSPNLPMSVTASVDLDHRSYPGKVRVVATALNLTNEVLISPEDAFKLADALYAAFEAAELMATAHIPLGE